MNRPNSTVIDLVYSIVGENNVTVYNYPDTVTFVFRFGASLDTITKYLRDIGKPYIKVNSYTLEVYDH